MAESKQDLAWQFVGKAGMLTCKVAVIGWEEELMFAFIDEELPEERWLKFDLLNSLWMFSQGDTVALVKEGVTQTTFKVELVGTHGAMEMFNDPSRFLNRPAHAYGHDTDLYPSDFEEGDVLDICYQLAAVRTNAEGMVLVTQESLPLWRRILWLRPYVGSVPVRLRG